MIAFFRKQKLAFITVVYWFLLIYIVAALVWWFVALLRQNEQMFTYKLSELNKDDPAYEQKLWQITNDRERKTIQYIGEGATFLLLILAGAVFVYRVTRKQIRLQYQQQNFMMAVTHELKTPIAITQLNLETLQKRKLDEAQQKKLVTVALQETNRLNVLTNNILIASQLESGSYAINKQELDLSKLVNNSANEFAVRFSGRSIQKDIDENIIVNGETLLLQMLVNNLVDNALKYSPVEKPVTVILKQTAKKAILQVIDEGAGIPPEEKKKVFRKFYRSGNEATRTAKGTGLGLYLCKRIAHDHKGTVDLKNNQPHGCIFTVILNRL